MGAENIKVINDKMELIRGQVRTLREILTAAAPSEGDGSIDDLDSKNSCLSILSELAYSFQDLDQIFDTSTFVGASRICDLKTQVEYCLNVVRNLSMETISPAPIILESWFRNIDLMNEILDRIAEIVLGSDEPLGAVSGASAPDISGTGNSPLINDLPKDAVSEPDSSIQEPPAAVEMPLADNLRGNQSVPDSEQQGLPEMKEPSEDASSNNPDKMPEDNSPEEGRPPEKPSQDDAKQSSAELYAARFARFGPIAYERKEPDDNKPAASDISKNSELNAAKQPIIKSDAPEIKPLQEAPNEIPSETPLQKDPTIREVFPINDDGDSADKKAEDSDLIEMGGSESSDTQLHKRKKSKKEKNGGGDEVADVSFPEDSKESAQPNLEAESFDGDSNVRQFEHKKEPLTDQEEQSIEQTIRKANELVGGEAPDSSAHPPVEPVNAGMTVTDRLSLIHEALEKLISARNVEKDEEARRREDAAHLASQQGSLDKSDEVRKLAEKEALMDSIIKQENLRREEFSQTLMKEVTSLHAELTGKILELEKQIGDLSDKEQRVEDKLETQYREQINILESRLQRLKDEIASEKLKSGLVDERKVLEIIEERESSGFARIPMSPAAVAPLSLPEVERTTMPIGDAPQMPKVNSQLGTEIGTENKTISVWNVFFKAVRFFLLSFVVAIVIVGGLWFLLERVLLKEPKVKVSSATVAPVRAEKKSSSAFNVFADTIPVSLEKRSLRLFVLQLRDNPRPSGRVQVANMLRTFKWKGVPEVLLETAKSDPDAQVAIEAFASFKEITKYPGVADSNYAAVDNWWMKNKAKIDATLEDAD